jgi:hypothetical protein
MIYAVTQKTYLGPPETYLGHQKTYFAGKKTGFPAALCWYYRKITTRVFFMFL